MRPCCTPGYAARVLSVRPIYPLRWRRYPNNPLYTVLFHSLSLSRSAFLSICASGSLSVVNSLSLIMLLFVRVRAHPTYRDSHIPARATHTLVAIQSTNNRAHTHTHSRPSCQLRDTPSALKSREHRIHSALLLFAGRLVFLRARRCRHLPTSINKSVLLSASGAPLCVRSVGRSSRSL